METRFILSIVGAFTLFLSLGPLGCMPSGGDIMQRSGGTKTSEASGAGGAVSSGGTTASGGKSASGGTTASGGKSSSGEAGGKGGSGGEEGSGGSSGSGGTSTTRHDAAPDAPPDGKRLDGAIDIGRADGKRDVIKRDVKVGFP
jgi:hypothetical protein